MGKEHQKRVKYIDINYLKLERLISDSDFTASELSVMMGYNSKWLSGIKRNKRPKITLEVAEKIAKCLDCTIQDFAEGPYYDPVTFFAKQEVKKRFRSMFREKKRYVELAEILRFIDANDERLNDLLLFTSSWAGLQRQQLANCGGDQWIKILYISTLAKELAKMFPNPCPESSDSSDENLADSDKTLWINCKEQDFADRYSAIIRRGIPKAREKSETYMRKFREGPEIEYKKEVIQKIVEDKCGRKVEEAIEDDDNFFNRVSTECAEFIYRFLTSRANDPSIDLQVAIYRRGELY